MPRLDCRGFHASVMRPPPTLSHVLAPPRDRLPRRSHHGHLAVRSPGAPDPPRRQRDQYRSTAAVRDRRRSGRVVHRVHARRRCAAQRPRAAGGPPSHIAIVALLVLAASLLSQRVAWAARASVPLPHPPARWPGLERLPRRTECGPRVRALRGPCARGSDGVGRERRSHIPDRPRHRCVRDRRGDSDARHRNRRSAARVGDEGRAHACGRGAKSSRGRRRQSRRSQSRSEPTSASLPLFPATRRRSRIGSSAARRLGPRSRS